MSPECCLSLGTAMSDHRMDRVRAARAGSAEGALCDRTSTEHIAAILQTARKNKKQLLLMRLTAKKAATLEGEALDHDSLSETAIFGSQTPTPLDLGIGIVTAGTPDVPIAAKAHRMLAFLSVLAPITADIGAAGQWRLLYELNALRQHRVLISVARMKAALFSVLAGLTLAPIFSVPAPVGHGVAKYWRPAVDATLGSRAPRLAFVNIGNELGAACAAWRRLRA